MCKKSWRRESGGKQDRRGGSRVSCLLPRLSSPPSDPMDPSTTSFSLTTALSYSSARSPSPFSLLPRHLKRLKDAHENLARDLPGSWCSRMGMPTSEQMEAELDRAVEEARKKEIEGDLRVRCGFSLLRLVVCVDTMLFCLKRYD